jgi:D-alanyl-lipoteichoic acid acyltransferase DltB (MBOAT superfamily)
MVFSSHEFVFGFLPIVVGGYILLCRKANAAAVMVWLVLASLAFYGWWNIDYVPLIIVLILANYLIGWAVAVAKRARGVICAAGVIMNLAVLGYFKYAGFAVANINALGGDLEMVGVALPLAISFFTFQKIAFLVDVYEGRARPGGLLKFSLFVLFFPQLIAGPIVHFREVAPQFESRAFSAALASNLAAGVMTFVIGLFKKVALADQISVYVGPVFDAADADKAVTFGEAWGAATSYALQIYFDFSGYTDMAIGLALMFGVVLPINFASPYKATSIIEFWRRWHITLSRFLRDYLYVPLGGNRRGPIRRYANIFVVMLLGGLWHGASWSFVVWGALHGAALAINHLWRTLRPNRRQTWCGIIVGWCATFWFVVIAWVFFRATSMVGAVGIVQSMFGVAPAPALGRAALFDPQGWLLIVLLLTIALLLPNTAEFMGRKEGTLAALRWRPLPAWGAIAAAVFVVSVYFMDQYAPFIYFNF